MTSDLSIVKSGLIGRMEEVCRQLLPDGRLEGGQWVSFNPVTSDYRPGRLPALKVRISGGDIGAWIDWRSGDKGDALGLVAYILTGDRRNAKETLAWGRDFLGLTRMSREERAALQRNAEQHRIRRDRDAEKARQRKLQSADRLFFAKPSTTETGPALCPQGTFALGENSPAERHALAYLAARAVDFSAIANVNRLSFRFSPATEWWKGATWKTDGGRKYKAERGPMFPAIHAAMRNAMGIVTACHVTFLDPIAPKKAPVTPAKLMWGEARGAVIEIATGPSAKPYWQADVAGICDPLIIAEGIETAGSFAAPCPEARCWAGGSLAGVMHAPAGLDCVEWILFARDNNAGNASAQKQFEAALEALEQHGKRVVVEASHVGDDFNDLARGEV